MIIKKSVQRVRLERGKKKMKREVDRMKGLEVYFQLKRVGMGEG